MKDDTLLHRQVNPAWTQGSLISVQNFISSQTFTPTKKDNECLSVYNGEVFSPEEAFHHFTQMGLLSAGTVSVTIKECQETGLSVHENNNPFPGHCCIDYKGLTSGQKKVKASRLRDYACLRDWTFKK